MNYGYVLGLCYYDCRFNMYDAFTSDMSELSIMSTMVHSLVEKELELGIPASNIVLVDSLREEPWHSTPA